MLNQNLLLAGDDSYNLSKSLRFRSSASAYLSRTPASAGNRKTWTWSGWVKRGSLGSRQSLLYCITGTTDSTFLILGFDSSDRFEASGYITQFRTSTAVYRDPSAWYHIVIAFDTTQATANNRLRIYVNNLEITAWTTNNAFSQNTDYAVNQNTQHIIGGGGYLPFDGYLADTYLIDGQSLTPSSFGEFDLTTGVWQPKKYAGTYGTNGFYLPFTDVATTSGSNAGLGKDFSGNGNYWNTNNISVTAGATYDSMKDVPTLTDADTANYCVLNPLNKILPYTAISQGNLYCDLNAGAYGVYGTIASSAKSYFEAVCTGTLPLGVAIGVAPVAKSISSFNVHYYSLDGKIYVNNTVSATGATWTTNDIIGVAYEQGGSASFYKNGVLQATVSMPSDVDFVPEAYQTQTQPNSVIFNFGQRPFSYSPPTGFKSLNTYNLPTPTIGSTASTLASKNFDISLYNGNGSTQAVTNAGGFQPDLVWVKGRNYTWSHYLFDVIRTAGKALYSNLTNAEATDGGFTSFNSNGFSVGSGALNDNTVPSTYVAWQWKANGSAVSNTAGSITSQVSANASAGFSVVTYTGTGANATVGHGLGVAPKFIIAKARGAVIDWQVYTSVLGKDKTLNLNLTGAVNSAANYWGVSDPTSSVFGLSAYNGNNASGGTFVAYCFSEVAGYSKFGSYTGNGSSDGPFVHLGFRPKFVMIKRTDSAQDWFMWDSARNGYNMNNYLLFANTSQAEYSGTESQVDLLSNGFKIRAANPPSAGSNASGGTYIFMAFAESPFKNSLAR